MTAYLLDGAVILILLFSIIFGYRRGFVKSAVKTVGFVAAFVIAFSLSGTLATSVFNAVIDKPLKAYASQKIVSEAGESVEMQLDQVMNDLPKWQKTVLGKLGVSSAADVFATWKPKADDTVTDAVDAVIRPPIIAVLKLIAFLVLFIILMAIVLLLSKAIRKVFRVPFLRQLDGTLGALTGAIQGVLWVVALVTIMEIYVSLAPGNGWITETLVRETTLVRLAVDCNPLTAAVGSLWK